MPETVLIEYPNSKIVQDLVFNICRRADEGLKKYGVTIDENHMSALNGLREASEEITDYCVYMGKSISEASQYDPAKAARWAMLQAKAIDLALATQKEIFDIEQKGKLHDSGCVEQVSLDA